LSAAAAVVALPRRWWARLRFGISLATESCTQASSPAPPPMAVAAPGLQDRSFRSRQLPADAAETILVGSYPIADPASAEAFAR
jgi:hypothetical protein